MHYYLFIYLFLSRHYKVGSVHFISFIGCFLSKFYQSWRMLSLCTQQQYSTNQIDLSVISVKGDTYYKNSVQEYIINHKESLKPAHYEPNECSNLADLGWNEIWD